MPTKDYSRASNPNPRKSAVGRLHMDSGTARAAGQAAPTPRILQSLRRGGAAGKLQGDTAAWSMDALPQFNRSVIAAGSRSLVDRLLPKPMPGSRPNLLEGESQRVEAMPGSSEQQIKAATTLYERGVLFSITPTPGQGQGDGDAVMYARPATFEEAARSGRSAGLVLEAPTEFVRLFPEPPNVATSFFADSTSVDDSDSDASAESELMSGDAQRGWGSIYRALTGGSTSQSQLFPAAVAQLAEVGAPVTSSARQMLQAWSRAASGPATYGAITTAILPHASQELTIMGLGGLDPRPHYSWETDSNFVRFAASLGATFAHRELLPQLDYRTVLTGDGLRTDALCPKGYVTSDGVLVMSSAPYLAGGFFKKLARKIKKVVKKVAKVVKKIVKNPVFKAVASVAKGVLSATPIGAAVNVATKVAKGVVTAVKAAKAVKKGIQIAKAVKKGVQAAKSIKAAAKSVKEAASPRNEEAATQQAVASPDSGAQVAEGAAQLAAAATTPNSGATQISDANKASDAAVIASSVSPGGAGTQSASIESGPASSPANSSPTIQISALPSVAAASLAKVISDTASLGKNLRLPILIGDPTSDSAGLSSDAVASIVAAWMGSVLAPALRVAESSFPGLYAQLSSAQWDSDPDAASRVASLVPLPNPISRMIVRLPEVADPLQLICAAILPTVIANSSGDSASAVYRAVASMRRVPALDPRFSPVPDPASYADYAAALWQSFSDLPDGVRQFVRAAQDFTLASMTGQPALLAALTSLVSRIKQQVIADTKGDAPSDSNEGPERRNSRDAISTADLSGDFPAFLLDSRDASGSSSALPSNSNGTATGSPSPAPAAPRESGWTGTALARAELPRIITRTPPTAVVAMIPAIVRLLHRFIKYVAPAISRGFTVSALPPLLRRAVEFLARALGCDPQTILTILLSWSLSEILEALSHLGSQGEGNGPSKQQDTSSHQEEGETLEASDVLSELQHASQSLGSNLGSDGVDTPTWASLVAPDNDGVSTAIMTRSPINP